MISASTTPQRIVVRARIVLLRAVGRSKEATAAEAIVSRSAVIRWERRSTGYGLGGLEEAPGRGTKPSIPDAKKDRIISQATQPTPMARQAGGAPASVQRIWAANEIKPHLTRTFKVSRDPNFETKFWDIIGLYINPPAKALVLCCDEESRCRALERAQPGLPFGIGHIRTRTHDYTRHGTVTLSAALNYLDGRILSATAAQHTHVEWLAFLKKLHRQPPAALAMHLIVDNYATHKHAAVCAWLEKHPRFHVHSTPTGSSWLHFIERFFRQLTDDVVCEGSFASVTNLVSAIDVHLAHHNLKPTPYRWKAEGAAILEKTQRACLAQAKTVL